MNRPFRALIAVGALCTASGASAVDLAECAAIKDDAVRLYCYDRAAGRIRDAVPAPAPESAAVTPTAPEAAAPVAAPAAAEAVVAKPPKRIESRIVGTFQGWSTGTQFKLENGETWEAVGAGSHYSKSESPKVVIERDFIGQNLMSVEGVKSRALVRKLDD